MKYLCLAHYDTEKFDTPSPAEVDALAPACRPHGEALRASGRLVAQASLHPPAKLNQHLGWAIELRPIEGFVETRAA
ncbi:MAG: hypothetical protein AB1689_04370 [Thermodesulfobacteriota bacterium]